MCLRPPPAGGCRFGWGSPGGRTFRWGVPGCLLALVAVGADAGPRPWGVTRSVWGSPTADKEEEASADERLLKEHGLPADGPGLLAFFKKRARLGVSEARIKALVRQLGDDSFEKREEASRELLALGPRARPHLTEALKDPDLEIRKRAGRCLKGITSGADYSTRLHAAGVRVLARLNPPGAAGALLTYLPAAENDAVAEEVRGALARLAVRVLAEGARSVADLLDRRTRLGLVPADRAAAVPAAEQVLTELA